MDTDEASVKDADIKSLSEVQDEIRQEQDEITQDSAQKNLFPEEEAEKVPTIEDLIKEVEDFVEQDIRDIEILVLPAEDLEQFPEPQITSSDPQERRIARRLRIRNKIREKRRLEEAKIKEELGDEDDDENKFDPDNVVESQIESSTVRLLELIQDGRELISNVKVAAVSYEVQRRDKVRLERAERRKRLETAANEARIRFMEISNQWAAVNAEIDPLDINSATEMQRDKCMEVIERKDGIIEELKKELEEADLNFVKDLERQEDEINIVVDRINQQIDIMRTAANRELELLEAAIAVEREEMMKENETEWQELIEKKEFIESETNVIRNDIIEKHEKSIDAMETEQREQLKIKRTEQTSVIHNMQLQLQEIEALCLFNSEKLNHNYRVLKKRADENQIIKSQQKRTITKLQDVVSNLRKRIVKKEAALSNEMKKMTSEFHLLQRNIGDMEQRASQAAALSNSKFLSLWQFNQSEAQKLIKKIASVDQIMYEQFLDIPAPPLQLPNQSIEDLPSYKYPNRSSEDGTEYNNAVPDEKIENLILSTLTEDRALKSILIAVSKYASFLIEENVKDVINNFSPADQVIVRLDKILTTVGVKTEEEIRTLVKHFYYHLVCRTCENLPPSDDDTYETVEEEEALPQEDCQDQFVEEIVSSVRRLQEEELEDDERERIDVMEAISSTVRERIALIDYVIAQEVTDSATAIEDSPDLVSLGQLTQVFQPGAAPRGQRDTLIIPDNVTFIANVLPRTTTTHSDQTHRLSSLSQLQRYYRGKKYSLGWCLQEKHEVTIDRLVLVKALCAYSKDINNRTKQNEVKSLDNLVTEKWMTVSRCLSNLDIKNFWKAFDIVSKEKEQLWDTFSKGLKEYYNELSERSRLNDEIIRLKRNNADMMRLLQKYLSISTEQTCEMDFPMIKKCFSESEQLTNPDNK